MCLEFPVAYERRKYVEIRTVPQFRPSTDGFLPRRPRFELGSSHVKFVVDKVAMVQVFSKYFDFP
jgi:hypothetical protein